MPCCNDHRPKSEFGDKGAIRISASSGIQSLARPRRCRVVLVWCCRRHTLPFCCNPRMCCAIAIALPTSEPLYQFPMPSLTVRPSRAPASNASMTALPPREAPVPGKNLRLLERVGRRHMCCTFASLNRLTTSLDFAFLFSSRPSSHPEHSPEATVCFTASPGHLLISRRGRPCGCRAPSECKACAVRHDSRPPTAELPRLDASLPERKSLSPPGGCTRHADISKSMPSDGVLSTPTSAYSPSMSSSRMSMIVPSIKRPLHICAASRHT